MAKKLRFSQRNGQLHQAEFIAGYFCKGKQHDQLSLAGLCFKKEKNKCATGPDIQPDGGVVPETIS